MQYSTLFRTLAILGIFTFPMVGQAQKKGDAGKEMKAGAHTAKEYVDLMEAMFANMNGVAEAVTGISTDEEVETATEALQTSTKELRTLQKKLKALGAPNPKVKKEIDGHDELGPAGKEASKALQDAMKDIPKDNQDFGVALQGYGTALTELGNDMTAMDSASGGTPKAETKEAGTAKAADYVRVLNTLLEVQDRSATIMEEVTDEDGAKDAARKIKGLNAEAKKIVAEFHGLGTPSAEANAAVEKNKQIPARTKEVVEHIAAGYRSMMAVDGAKEIIAPVMEEFSKTCQTIADAPQSGGKPAGKADGPAPDASEYVAVMTEFFKNVDQGCTILDGVTDEDSATQATEDLGKCSEDLAAILERKTALPEPDAAVSEALGKNKTIGVLGKKAKARLDKTEATLKEMDLEASDDVKSGLKEAVEKWIAQLKSMN